MAYTYDAETNTWAYEKPAAPPAAVGMPPPPQEESGFLHRTVGDPALALAKGAMVGVPSAAVGVANFVTGGQFEGPLGALGNRLKDMGERFDKQFSTQHQSAAAEVASTKGFFPTLGAYLSNPGYLVDTAVEQLPTMFGGAKLGQAISKTGALGTGTAQELARRGAAVGEGTTAGGQSVESIRQEAEGGETTFGQRMVGAVSGALTGTLGYGAGKLAHRMGIEDIDVAFAGGRQADGGRLVGDTFVRGPGIASRIGRGALSEGVLEEMPQSAQEQMAQNLALDRPIMQGVAEAAAQGLVLGSAMGGTVAGALHDNKLRDGVAAIQYLSQPPTLDEAGNPVVDEKMTLDALRALVTLHPPGSTDGRSMREWQLDQIERINKGEGVDWSQFGAITTNQGLMDLAAETIASVEERKVAAEQDRQLQTAIANGQQPAAITDDMGNEIARPAPTAPPTKQEIAQVEKLQKALAANDTETLARAMGKIVRPTAPAPEPAAAAPAAPPPPTLAQARAGATTNAAADYSKFPDAMLTQTLAQQEGLGEAANRMILDGVRAEITARAEGRSSAPLPKVKTGALKQAVRGTDKLDAKGITNALGDVEKSLQSGNFAEARRLVAEGLAVANTEVAAGKKNHKLEQWTRAQQFVDAHSPKEAARVQTPPVNQGAESKSGDAQNNASVLVSPPAQPAAGDAAGQSAQETTQEVPAEAGVVAPTTEEKVDESPVPAQKQAARKGKSTRKGQPVRQEGQPVRQEGAGSQSGNAPAVPAQEVKDEPPLSLVQQLENAAENKAGEKPAKKRTVEKPTAFDERVEAEAAAAEAGAKLEPAEHAWDRLRGDRKTPGPRYIPTWAEAKAFIQSVKDAAGKLTEWTTAHATLSKEIKESKKVLARLEGQLEKGTARVQKAESAQLAAKENVAAAQRQVDQHPENKANKIHFGLMQKNLVKAEDHLATERNALAYAGVESETATERSHIEGMEERLASMQKQIDTFKADQLRAKELDELLVKFDTDRVYGDTVLTTENDLLRAVVDSRMAPWRAQREATTKKEKDAARLKAEREANKEALLDLADKFYTHSQLSKADQTEFMERYKAHFKGNAKAKTFDEALTQVTDTILYGERVVGSTTPAVKAILEVISGTTRANELLDVLQSIGSNPVLKPLAAALRTLDMGGVKIVYKDEVATGTDAAGNIGHKRGSYSQSTNTITIYRGGENSQIILHEMVHAATAHNIRRVAARMGKAANQAQAQQERGYRELVELFEYLRAAPEMKGEYANKNVIEFVAEVHANPALQEKLRGMTVPKGMFGRLTSKLGSIMQAYVDAIRSLLGFPPRVDNALDRAIELTAPYFAPNTKQTAVKIKAAADARQQADNMVTPMAAITYPFQRAGQFLNAMDNATARGFWSSASAAKRKLMLSLQSSGTIQQFFRSNPVLGHISDAFEKFFKVGEDNAAARNGIVEASINGHVRELKIALNKSKNPDKYNHILGWLAGESSNLGINIEEDYAANKRHFPKLDPAHKDHIDRLHREFLQLRREQPELAKLLKNGERVSRLMFVEQLSALVGSSLRNLQVSNPQVKAAAEDVINKFAKKIDILQSDKGLTNADPKLHYNALSSTLDRELQALFSYVEKTYPLSDLAEEMKFFAETYNKGVNLPYMHLGRHGMYYVKFTVADNSAQTTAKLEKLLASYKVAIGPFHGSKGNVFLRLDNPAAAEDLSKLVRAQPGLLAQKDGKPVISSGAISTANSTEVAIGQNKVTRELRARLKSKMEAMATAGNNNPHMKDAYDAMMAAMTDSMMDMLEVNSARQANQARDHVPGYSTNYEQNFSKRAQWAVTSVANIYTADAYSDAFRDMQNAINESAEAGTDAATLTAVKGQEVHDELARRFSNSFRPAESGFIQKMSVFGNNFYLALSPAYAIGNLMQPYMLTLPYLGGRFGFVRSAKAMARASNDARKIIAASVKAGWDHGKFSGVLDVKLEFDKLGLPPAEIDLIKRLLRSGIVDSTQSHELGRLAEGEVSKFATAAKAASAFNHYTEVANRLSVGLAAYRLSATRTHGKGMSVEERTRYAIESIRRTQYDYSEHNTARAIGRHGFLGAATPLFMQFQRFAFFTMEHYALMASEAFFDKNATADTRKDARRALAYTLGTTAVFTGTMGLPFTTALVAVANSLRGDDDDKDLRAMYREWLAGVFGKDMAEIVAKGVVGRGIGVDITGSLGQQDLLPGSRFAADRRDWQDKMKDQSKTLFGPAINAGFDIYGGAQRVADGDVAEGVKMMLPRALKGPWAAVNVAASGVYQDKSGRELPIEVSWADYPKMIAGFTPAKKADQAEANFFYQSQQTQTKQDKAKAQKQVVRAIEDGEYGDALDTLMEYQIAHPGNPITGVGSTLAARARGRAIGELTGIIDPNVKHLPTLQEYSTWAK